MPLICMIWQTIYVTANERNFSQTPDWEAESEIDLKPANGFNRNSKQK